MGNLEDTCNRQATYINQLEDYANSVEAANAQLMEQVHTWPSLHAWCLIVDQCCGGLHNISANVVIAHTSDVCSSTSVVVVAFVLTRLKVSIAHTSVVSVRQKCAYRVRYYMCFVAYIVLCANSVL